MVQNLREKFPDDFQGGIMAHDRGTQRTIGSNRTIVNVLLYEFVCCIRTVVQLYSSA